MVSEEVIKEVDHMSTLCVTAKDCAEFLIAAGAKLIDNTGVRMMFVMDNALIKVSRSDVRTWNGKTYLSFENSAELAVYTHVCTLSKETCELLVPVQHLTTNARALVMEYTPQLELTTENTPDFMYYARELSSVYGLNLVSPWSTTKEYKQIHYPYVHTFPFINKPALHD